MSQENVEVVQEMMDATQRGDRPVAIAAFHPEVELDQTRMPDGGVYHGADKVWSFYRRWFGSWEGVEIAPQRFIDVDDNRVLVLLEFRGTGRESGIEVSMATGDLYTLRDGRIVQATGYPDQRDALDAVGLRE
jgi:ketosteroid isomerase-like protein